MSDLRERSNAARLQDPRQSKLDLGGKRPDPAKETHVDKRSSHSPAAKAASTKHRGDSDSVRPHMDARGGGRREGVDCGPQSGKGSQGTGTKLPSAYKK